MNLLDRYVAEIGKGLPRKNRADIETEIRSTLQDMLDERAAAAGKPADDAMIRDLLKEYGAPAKVAASYRTTQYLVGPRMFPMFLLVTKIVVTVLVVVSAVGFGISFANYSSGPEFIRELGKFAAELFSGLMAAFGNIVLVFAILERVLPASELKTEEDEEWNPDELASEPNPEEVKRAEPVFGIVFTVIWLLILNLYPNLIGIGYVSGGTWTFVPVLTEAFFRYLPWINLLGVLQIGLNLVLLRTGQWSTALRVVDIVLDICSIVLAWAMLTGPALVNVSAESLAGTPLAGAANTLAPILNFLPTMILTLIIVVSAVEVGRNAYRMFRRPPAKQYGF